MNKLVACGEKGLELSVPLQKNVVCIDELI